MIKNEVAQKMVQHTHYDRKTGKFVRTMVPETKEHESKIKEMNHGSSKRYTKNVYSQHKTTNNTPKDHNQFKSRGFHE